MITLAIVVGIDLLVCLFCYAINDKDIKDHIDENRRLKYLSKQRKSYFYE